MKISVPLLLTCAIPLALTQANCAQSAPADSVAPAKKAATTEVAPAPIAVPADVLKTLKPNHPRLLVNDDTWAQLKKQRAGDAALDAFLTRQNEEARALLTTKPTEREQIGRRMLGSSRKVMDRVLLLAMQYKLTGEKPFLDRARAELLNAADYPDWNPSHFLDVAEMTAAFALSYDWLYDDLDMATRKRIVTAIVEKALKPGTQPENQQWKDWVNNWNSVCFGGMVLGALAIAEDEPELAKYWVSLALQENPKALASYAPDGIYPEGPGYWYYGSSYQLMLIDAMNSALGTDFGLTKAPGFLQSASALYQSRGPSGAPFNYSDSAEESNSYGLSYWFAKQLKQPAIANLDYDYIGDYVKGKNGGNRTVPLVALWWLDPSAAPTTLPLSWHGEGDNSLATFRSKWDDPDAMWLAIKGGQASLTHGHMDVGSFVFESDGVRWASDLGSQNYESSESKGLKITDRSQDGDRWKIFRNNNFSHNTLTINEQLHVAKGVARFTHFSQGENAGAILNLSPVFKGQARRVTRGFLFRGGKDVLIRDEVTGLKAGDKVRFAMMTAAKIAIAAGGKTATLSENGKTLKLDLASRFDGQWEIASAQGPQPFDAQNKGYQLLVANFVAPAEGGLNWTVTLTPGSAGEVGRHPMLGKSLGDWTLAAVK